MDSYEAWETLIFGDADAYRRVLMQFGDMAHTLERDGYTPTSNEVVRRVLTDYREYMLRDVVRFDRDGRPHPFLRFLSDEVDEALAQIPSSLIEQVAEFVYGDLDDPHAPELPVRWEHLDDPLDGVRSAEGRLYSTIPVVNDSAVYVTEDDHLLCPVCADNEGAVHHPEPQWNLIGVQPAQLLLDGRDVAPTCAHCGDPVA
jgi:hypothetical protein